MTDERHKALGTAELAGLEKASRANQERATLARRALRTLVRPARGRQTIQDDADVRIGRAERCGV
jgi:hypothetical protein